MSKKLSSRREVDIVFMSVFKFRECRDSFAIRTIRANRMTLRTIRNVALSERLSSSLKLLIMVWRGYKKY